MIYQAKFIPISDYKNSMCVFKMPCYEIFLLTSNAHEVHVRNVDCLLKLCLPGWVGPTSDYETSMCFRKMNPKMSCMKDPHLHPLHFGNVDYCLRKLGLPGWAGATGVG